MLTSLHITNVVLINQMTLSFAAGLSALTGETGAGKSILLDSLGLALGMRADAGLVRKGTDSASVTAIFDMPKGHPIYTDLKDQDIVVTDEIVLRRVLGSDGRSKAYINDIPVGVTFLKSIGDILVDIHGQFETYGLLNPAIHQAVLDNYTGSSHQLVKVAEAYAAWKDIRRQIDEAKEQARIAAANESFLKTAVDDLEKLAPQSGEETDLVEKRKRIQNRDAVLEALSFASEALGGEGGADMMLAQAEKKLMRQADKIEMPLDGISEALTRASSDIGEACRQIEDIARRFQSNDMNSEALEDRLYALRGMARKYQVTPDELPAMYESYRDQLRLINHQDQLLAQLEKSELRAAEAYKKEAAALHDMRVTAGKKLDKAVQNELKPLKLDKAIFVTDIVAQDDASRWGPHGYDQIQFLVTTNAGTDAGPLHKVASGGEMARFMLALKVVLAEKAAHQGVYVFDEIDTGIGGATADAVGERLARLAKQHQVMVVTHSPQVAARAMHHWMVTKAGGTTQVIPLDLPSRREEIARMLAGSEITVEARAAAAKLLETGT